MEPAGTRLYSMNSHWDDSSRFHNTYCRLQQKHGAAAPDFSPRQSFWLNVPPTRCVRIGPAHGRPCGS